MDFFNIFIVVWFIIFFFIIGTWIYAIINAIKRRNGNKRENKHYEMGENAAASFQSRVVGYCPYCNAKIDSQINQKCLECSNDYVCARCGKCRNLKNHQA